MLTVDQGSVIDGAGTSDVSGISVSIAGDVDGDGFDDLLIGASLADAANNARSNAGESYLVFGGPALPATIDLAALGTAGVTIYGVDAEDERAELMPVSQLQPAAASRLAQRMDPIVPEDFVTSSATGHWISMSRDQLRVAASEAQQLVANRGEIAIDGVDELLALTLCD